MTPEQHAEVNRKYAEDLNKSRTAKNESGKPTPETPPVAPPATVDAKVEGTKEEKPPVVPETTPAPAAIDEDKIYRERLKKQFGTDDESELKKLISKSAPTEEDKKELKKLYDQQVLNEFLSSGKTIEDYNTIQKSLAQDNVSIVRRDYFEANAEEMRDWSEAERNEAFLAAYKLDFEEPEGNEQPMYSERQRALAKAQLDKRAEKLRSKIQSPIKQAETSYKTKQAQSEAEKQIQFEAEEFFSKQNGSLSKIKYTNEKHGEVDMEVPKEIYESVKEAIKNPKNLLALFSEDYENKEGQKLKRTDKAKLTSILIKGLSFEKMVADVAEAAYGKGATDATKNLPPAPEISGKGNGGVKPQLQSAHEKMAAANEHNRKQMGR